MELTCIVLIIKTLGMFASLENFGQTKRSATILPVAGEAS